MSDSTEYQFQAEIARLLQLLSHSLYQHPEIAIRELVSNASDALDKYRHDALVAGSPSDDELAITIEQDADERVLTIRDNGVGMTREELVENLGTIAHSGSLDYLTKLSDDADRNVSLIGQFGVGFYSSFMLAERVEVFTKSARQDAEPLRWESDGSGRFTIDVVEAEKAPDRGTAVVLHLRDEAKEFARPDRLKHVLKTYSTFVPHPIRLGDAHVNDQPPIWVEPKANVTAEQYERFYRYLTHRASESPLWHLHLSSDSPFQFHTILFCPPTNPELMGFGKAEHGLHLCAKRILVQNDCRKLLPEYLRFLYGLVDSADLPLNVSREALQDNRVFHKIRDVLTKRVLSHLAKLAKNEPETYTTFYKHFGPTLREGVAGDFVRRDDLVKLLRFESLTGDGEEEFTSLADYVGRAAEGQTQIYFATGADAAGVRRRPNMEVFRSRGIEVLLLTDPVDEIVLSTLGEFDGKPIVGVESAEVELPPSTDGEEEAEESAEAPAGFEHVLRLFRDALGERVEEVRRTDRLTDSAVALVTPGGGVSAHLEHLLAAQNPEFAGRKRILEVNPRHPLVRRLGELAANDQNDGFVRDCGNQLYANALLLAGLAPRPEELADRVEGFMREAAEKRSAITLAR